MKFLIKSLLFAASFSLLMGFTTFGQSHPQLNHFHKLKNILLKGNGDWYTENPDYDATKEYSDSLWTYQFAAGNHPNMLKLQIGGIVPSKNLHHVFWDGIYTWDGAKSKFIYVSTNPMGGMAMGISEGLTDSSLTLIFSVTSPAGKISKHKDIEIIYEDKIVSKTFELKNNKWVAGSTLLWRRKNK